MASSLANSLEQEKVFTLEKSSTPTEKAIFDILTFKLRYKAWETKQRKSTIHHSTSIRFLFFYSRKPRSQVRILIC